MDFNTYMAMSDRIRTANRRMLRSVAPSVIGITNTNVALDAAEYAPPAVRYESRSLDDLRCELRFLASLTA